MPTMAEYAASGGYARDAQTARNVANMPSPSYSSGSSSSRSKIGGVPATPPPTGTSGFMNPPSAGGSGSGVMQIPTASGGVPAPYQVGGVTYTPGPANWGSMSQSERDNYGSSLSGGAIPQNNSNNGMLFPPKQNGRGPGGVVGAEGGWADGTFYAPLQTPQSNKNYAVTADMGMGGRTPPPYSATQTGGIPAFQSAYDKAAAEKSAGEQAAARIAKMQLGVQQGVDKYNTARKNAFDYTNQTTKDNRVLAASMFNTNNDPFNGMTGYKQAQILRSNNLEDTAANNNYQSDVGANNQKLTDFMAAAPEQQQAMYDQLLQQLQSTANQQDQIALQARGQDMSQSNSDRSFTAGRADAAQTQSNSDRAFYAGRQDTAYSHGRDTQNDTIAAGNTAYNRGQDQIKNDRNAANDTLTLRKQHIDEANYYSDKYGITVEPKDDFQLVLDQVAGRQTAAQQTAAQKSEDAKRAEAWKRVEWGGSVQTQEDADLLNIPVGTQSQKAKDAAMDSAYKNRTLDISQQRANKPAAVKQPAQPKQTNTTTLISNFNKLYTARNKDTGQMEVTNKAQLESAILGQHLPDDQTAELYNYYGIPIPR